jgi:hypothetical protein
VAVIRIDTRGVTFMDSSALSCLIETDQRCREQGTRFEIIPSAPVTRLFELAGWSPIAARNGHAPGWGRRRAWLIRSGSARGLRSCPPADANR